MLKKRIESCATWLRGCLSAHRVYGMDCAVKWRARELGILHSKGSTRIGREWRGCSFHITSVPEQYRTYTVHVIPYGLRSGSGADPLRATQPWRTRGQVTLLGVSPVESVGGMAPRDIIISYDPILYHCMLLNGAYSNRDGTAFDPTA